MSELIGIVLGALGGGVAGVWYTIRQIPRILARMSDSQLSALADKVTEVRYGSAELGDQGSTPKRDQRWSGWHPDL